MFVQLNRSFQWLIAIYLTLGTPSLTGTTTLMINVENSNDKAPYFTPETQRAEVTEDTPIGTVFTTLKATDPDSSNSEALNFAISEPITAIDRNGQRVNNSKSFKVYLNFSIISHETFRNSQILY